MPLSVQRHLYRGAEREGWWEARANGKRVPRLSAAKPFAPANALRRAAVRTSRLSTCSHPVRRYGSPRRVIWPNRVLPPLEYCRDISPSRAANCRPHSCAPGARLQADQAPRPLRHHGRQLPAAHRAAPDRPALRIYVVQGKHILCQVDSDGSNVVHGLPLLDQIEHDTPQSWHLDAVAGRGSPLHSLDADHGSHYLSEMLRSAGPEGGVFACRQGVLRHSESWPGIQMQAL
jgi:hypothetical protein